MAGKKPLSTIGILIVAFLLLLSGHLLLKAWMPNVAYAGVGFLLIVLISSFVLIFRKDLFGFLMVLYVCSHFSYADNQGGLWNLMAFGMLGLFWASGGRLDKYRKKDILMNVLLGIFIIWNIVGWAMKNPVPRVTLMQGAAVFLGFIFVYFTTSRLNVSEERFRKFLSITFYMLLYQFAVALNQRYHILAWNTPMLGGYTDTGTSIQPGIVDTPGTIGHFELFAEYAALMLCLLVPLLSSSALKRELHFSPNAVVISIFVCLLIPMMTSTRSAAILIVMAVALYYVVFTMRIFSGIDRVGQQLRFIAVAAILLPLVGVYIGMHHLQSDLATLKSEKITAHSIVTGTATNRGSLYEMAVKRIEGGSWWAGYGFGIPRSNRWAWFGSDVSKDEFFQVADYHSLYLSLPMLYGWVGSVVFVLMILVTLFRCASAALRFRNSRGFLAVLVVGLTMFWGVFLADEYKISILRNPGYHMMFWIWLGLSNAAIRTLRYGNTAVSRQVGVASMNGAAGTPGRAT